MNTSTSETNLTNSTIYIRRAASEPDLGKYVTNWTADEKDGITAWEKLMSGWTYFKNYFKTLQNDEEFARSTFGWSVRRHNQHFVTDLHENDVYTSAERRRRHYMY